MVSSESVPTDSPAAYHHLSDNNHAPINTSTHAYLREEKEPPIPSHSFPALSIARPSPVNALPAAPLSFDSEYESKYAISQHEHKHHEDWAAHKDHSMKDLQLAHDHNIDGALTGTMQHTAADSSTTTKLDDSTDRSSYSALSIESAAEEEVPPFPWMMVLLVAGINLNDGFQQNVLW